MPKQATVRHFIGKVLSRFKIKIPLISERDFLLGMFYWYICKVIIRV